MTQVAPFVFADDVFALKGGTAINLFVRDMPRLSVDLDLVLPDHALSRAAAISQIKTSLGKASDQLKSKGFQTHLAGAPEAGETKLLVKREGIEVKVEVNYVMRGTVRPVGLAGLTPKAQDILEADLEIPVVSTDDVYGGKLVAALDRQHPRDLFDVMHLLGNGGITDGIRRAFVVYLASHNRPLHEVLFPPLRDVTYEFEANFNGMTSEPVELNALLAARDEMIATLHAGLDADERAFLISLAAGEPAWDGLALPHLSALPAIQWKLQNLAKLRATNKESSKRKPENWRRRSRR
ncbi:nucleotidyl transferase AbiEii/AbiGii toxin family protein [Variovorax sp. J22P271]|uniref:nucleotidyl transferase AbiEii/AbiGii toxin family protein n=1 Tax=Variovorax davisae TaxID=3053515 RepID=UPI002574DFE1|nr:nucleotidyl transferase AbiEii/AbiGii toxin family protein [Variovorax sp. J22P271]MDM0032102.1 nucleotidyl transferase AbiEii/AbiGii toxin family protein [Variovorax sp. J22P271]